MSSYYPCCSSLPELRWPFAISAAVSAALSAAIIYGLDVLTVQEAASPDSQGASSRTAGGPRGPPFFVEGLRAKPAVDGSLELSEAESE